MQLADEVQAIARTADLPRLRRMHVAGATAACASLFAHVSLPRDVQLSFDCYLLGEGAGSAAVPLGQTLAQALSASAPDFTQFDRCVAFSIETTGVYYTLGGWRRAPSLTPVARAWKDADITVSCPWKAAATDLATLLRPFILASVTHLRVGHLLWYLPGMFDVIAALCQSPGVESLVLDGTMVTHALRVVAQTSASEVALVNVDFKPADSAKVAMWLHSWSSGTSRTII